MSTTGSTSVPTSSRGRFLPTLATLSSGALGQLLWYAGVTTACVLAVFLIGRWQGWGLAGPGSAVDGVWLGVEARSTGVVVRGLTFLVPIGTGWGAVALAASLPWTLTRPLIELGVTRRVVAVATLGTLAAMLAFVVLVTALAAVVSAPTDPGFWWWTLVAATPALIALALAMLLVLVGATVCLRLSGWVLVLIFVALPLAALLVFSLPGLSIPLGAATAAVTAVVLVLVYLALMRRLPVP